MKQIIKIIWIFILACNIVSCTLEKGTKSFFKIEEEEKYWECNVLFEAKYKDIDDETLPGDSLNEEHIREISEGSGQNVFQGKIYLTQNNNLLHGFILIGDEVLETSGKVFDSKLGERNIILNYEGFLFDEIVYGNIVGALEKTEVIGKFSKVVFNTGNLIFGDFKLYDIYKQEKPQVPIKQEKQKPDCGKKIAEVIHNFRSPKTGRITRMKVIWYEHCVKTVFVDENGQELAKNDTIELSKDIDVAVGGIKIKVYDAPLNKKTTSKNPDGSDCTVQGEIKYISVKGCAKIKYYQYMEEYNQIIYQGIKGNITPIQKLHADGQQPITGSPPMPNTGESRPLIDIPSYPVNELPFNENNLNYPDDTEIHHYHKYITYVCCDDVLLGFVYWGYKVVYTIKNNKVASSVVTKIKPRWLNPETDTPVKDEVKRSCEGN